jgi:predicted metal-dependent peptidase
VARSRRSRGLDPGAKAFRDAVRAVATHPLFATLYEYAYVDRDDDWRAPHDQWALVTADGFVRLHPTRRGSAEEWRYAIAHCLLHLGLGHFQQRDDARAWNAACDVVVGEFLDALRFGRRPPAYELALDLNGRDEATLYEALVRRGVPDGYVADLHPRRTGRSPVDWERLLARGLAEAVSRAVDVAGGEAESLAGGRLQSDAQRARAWFIAGYPLLGALAAGFTIVEDPGTCRRLDIRVAAVDPEERVVYVNPGAGLDADECRFVLAHELLHVGLRHHLRVEGRDPYLWNVACDYVINGWLVEMGVGSIPSVGGLYDPQLRGESAETVYDRIATDLRRARKLMTLRGVGAGDILSGRRPPDWWEHGDGLSLDEFCRSALAQGLELHRSGGRGLLPSGLVEEIRALAQPPIPWDVALAHWFDRFFAPIETRRSYARPSRRQSATPAIPRPRTVPVQGALDGRTFGVVLDTSGSMDRRLLGQALGAIASYAVAHDVPAVRVVFCDAAAYDAGYLQPDAIAGRVRVRGRGGTVLQPGVDLLERAEDFPSDGPILVITDAWCDHVRPRRAHAYLVPPGARLPFVPKGPVFRMAPVE